MSRKLFDPDDFRIIISSKKGMKVNKPTPWHVIFNVLMSHAIYAAKQLDLKGDDLLVAAQNFCGLVDPETIFPAKEELQKELKEQEVKEMSMPTANPDYASDIADMKDYMQSKMEGSKVNE